MSELGRQVKYGIGKETTAGTAVSATNWINQLAFGLNPMVDYLTNESAYGVIEKTNNSDINHKWAEGTLEAKLTDETGGLMLLGAFGSVSTAANADASGNVYDHTFEINQDIDGQSFTLVRKDGLSTIAYPLARFGQWDLSMTLDDYVRLSAAIMAKDGSSTTATPAFSSETEFVAKHMSVKTATTVAGLSGATAVSSVESFTLSVNPNLRADFQSGSEDPYSFSSEGYDLSFEMTCRYNDTTYEDAFKNGTQLSLEVTAENTDVTIGTAANPALVFTGAKMFITDWTRNEELNAAMTQTMTGTIHYSVDDAYALKAVLTNLVTAY